MGRGEDELNSRQLKQIGLIAILTFAALVIAAPTVCAQTSGFRNAPPSAAQAKNPYEGDAQAAAGGKKLFAQNCAQCHGNNLQGMGPAPTLISAPVKNAKAGDLFWFISNGDLNKGMPGWSQLPKQQRWQIVTFVESKNASK
jgi:mono/diheme cytochrome c family protein